MHCAPFFLPKRHTQNKNSRQRATDNSDSGKQQQKKSTTQDESGIYPESTRPAPPPIHPGGERERGVHSPGRSQPGPQVAPELLRTQRCLPSRRPLQRLGLGDPKRWSRGYTGGLGKSSGPGGTDCPGMGTQSRKGSLQGWRGKKDCGEMRAN